MELTVVPKYKQAEAGLIPKDWQLSSINDLFSFEGGSQPPRDTFIFSEKEGYLRLIQIRDYKTDKYASYIPEGLARKKCSAEDIMIGRYGPPIFQILKGLKGAYNVALIKAIPTTEIYRDFGWYILTQPKLFEFVEKLSQRSSGQTGVDLAELRKYPIPLPPMKEQTAIATALSDTDALITGLEKLIAKKRNIKQGAMQELLKPKEGWEFKRLCEIAQIATGNTPLTSDRTNYGEDYFFVSPADLGKSKWILDTEKKLSEKGFCIARKFPKNSILFTCIGSTIGKSGIANRELTSNQQINAVFPNESYCSDFLFYVLILLSNKIKSSASEQAVPLINKTEFSEILIALPPILTEQKAIASILNDMDAGIEALERKLVKYKEIKQGMMQVLLTGKVRLA